MDAGSSFLTRSPCEPFFATGKFQGEFSPASPSSAKREAPLVGRFGGASSSKSERDCDSSLEEAKVDWSGELPNKDILILRKLVLPQDGQCPIECEEGGSECRYQSQSSKLDAATRLE